MYTRLELLESLFKALADRTRLRILALLAGGEICVCHIHESLRIPQPKASRHLAYLKRAGLIEGRRDGLWVQYRLASPADELVRSLIPVVNRCLDQLPTTTRDRKRLEKEVGRPFTPAPGCCADVEASLKEASLKTGPTTTTETPIAPTL